MRSVEALEYFELGHRTKEPAQPNNKCLGITLFLDLNERIIEIILSEGHSVKFRKKWAYLYED